MTNIAYNAAALGVTETNTEPHIIIDTERTVMVPFELTDIAVQYDHNIETVTFDCPRYWDGHDMHAMHIYISYQRSDGFIGCHPVSGAAIDEKDLNIMHFDWTISNEVTAVEGTILFCVNIKKIDESTQEEVQHWSSKVNDSLKVSKGLKCDN